MSRNLAFLAGALLAGLFAAAPARAADLYLSGNMIQSVGHDQASGIIAGGLMDIVGDDSDSSMGYGLQLGFGFKLKEVLPEGWAAWDSAFRMEAEFTYGREYEVLSDLETVGGASTPYQLFDEVKIWTAMPVLWFDMPLRRPLSKMFGRVPMLDPLTFSIGAGAGIAHVHIDAFDNISRGRDSVYKFSFQANTSLSYDFSDRTTLQFGYRYIDFGATDANLEFYGGGDAGTIDLDLYAHEFSVVLRWDYFSRPLESFSPTNWELPKWGKPKRPKWTKSWHMPRWLGGSGAP
jgi:opacity protein-like surface antigen